MNFNNRKFGSHAQARVFHISSCHTVHWHRKLLSHRAPWTKMAAIRTMTNLIIREFIHHPLLFLSSSKSCHSLFPTLRRTPGIALVHSSSRFGSFRCAASNSGGGDRKVSSRLSQVQQMLHEAEERASSAGNEPTPQITLGKVYLLFMWMW